MSGWILKCPKKQWGKAMEKRIKTKFRRRKADFSPPVIDEKTIEIFDF